MFLNEIKDNKGARNKFKRVGRGEGSGKGKTSGRGVKGQGSRSGVSIAGFEGGQMPLYQRLPKRGFSNHDFQIPTQAINLRDLTNAIDSKRIDASKEINLEVLKAAGLVHNTTRVIKLLSMGQIKSALTRTVNKASAKAIKAIEQAKGKITILDAQSAE